MFHAREILPRFSLFEFVIILVFMTIAQYIQQEKAKLQTLTQGLKVKPHLVIIQANENEGSNIYIRGKLADCLEVGLQATHLRFPMTITQEDLIKEINKHNFDPLVHGVIVQVPLPSHIDPAIIRRAVLPQKDVDGFHPLSPMMACTPKGIVDYLSASGFNFTGKHAVIIGRSYIVGRPLASALLDRHATVSVIHSKTKEEDKLSLLYQADLICVAVGKKWYLSDQKIKPSAWIVDIGITRDDGQIYGDVKPGRHAALQTPVPGGVGLLTRLSLLKNLWEAYTKQFKSKAKED
jgi:methylenetetrahydrofolate dehydrogenase (NADP+)/methenyltetrahydrofolate cyclohydrolase